MPYTQRMQLALARSRGYALLADVTARGISDTSLPPLRAVAELAPLLPDQMDAAAADAAAADHYAVFGLNLFAFESVFVDPECRLSGHVTHRVAESCATLGFQPPAGMEADALATELSCIAFLCGAEADAWEDRQTGAAEQARRLQRDFLRNHLLVWLPPLCEALARQERPVYAALGPLLATLCLDHYGELTPLPALASAPVEPTAPSAEGTPSFASLDDAGIRTIARRLLAPAQSGLFLARSDVTRLARYADLPASFGERAQMLTDLFHAAGHFERLLALLNALDQMAAQAESHHAALEEEYPLVAPFILPWQQRLDATRALLAAMRTVAREADAAASPDPARSGSLSSPAAGTR
jgi:TorA maturation chaperone TorD